MTEGEIVHYSQGLGYHALFNWSQSYSLGSECTLMLMGMQLRLKEVSSYLAKM